MPLFGDEYLEALYQKKTKSRILVKAYWKRFWSLFSVFRYDKIVIEKELFPYFFSTFEYLLSMCGVKYVVDYDDAIFHNYDLNSNPIIRFFLKNKINNVMRRSHCVVAGNSYLANRATKAGATKVIIIPTVVDISRYTPKSEYDNQPVVIGWIGSPSTFKYYESILPTLLDLQQKFNINLHVVGAKSENYPSLKFIDWSEETETRLIRNFDIGIMPLVDSPWEWGKCSYKLIQYMASAVPVVASPVGMNNDVVIPDYNGYLANNSQEWESVFINLINSVEKRKQFGENSRKLIEEKYSLELKSKVWLKILKF